MKFPRQSADRQPLVIVGRERHGRGWLLCGAEVGGARARRGPGEAMGARGGTARRHGRDEGTVTVDHEAVVAIERQARGPGGRWGREGEVLEHDGGVSCLGVGFETTWEDPDDRVDNIWRKCERTLRGLFYPDQMVEMEMVVVDG